MRSFALLVYICCSCSALTADQVDFSGAYADFGTVFGAIAGLLMLLLTARAVMNFLGR